MNLHCSPSYVLRSTGVRSCHQQRGHLLCDQEQDTTDLCLLAHSWVWSRPLHEDQIARPHLCVKHAKQGFTQATPHVSCVTDFGSLLPWHCFGYGPCEDSGKGSPGECKLSLSCCREFAVITCPHLVSHRWSGEPIRILHLSLSPTKTMASEWDRHTDVVVLVCNV